MGFPEPSSNTTSRGANLLGWVGTVDPMRSGGSATSTIPNGSNNMAVSRLLGLGASTTFAKIKIRVGTSSGNIDVGVYSSDGTTLTRVASTGSIACPAGAAMASITLACGPLDPTLKYFLALAADNTTATFVTWAGGDAATSTALTEVDGTAMAYISNAGGLFPLPASKLLSALSVGSSVYGMWLTAA